MIGVNTTRGIVLSGCSVRKVAIHSPRPIVLSWGAPRVPGSGDHWQQEVRVRARAFVSVASKA